MSCFLLHQHLRFKQSLKEAAAFFIDLTVRGGGGSVMFIIMLLFLWCCFLHVLCGCNECCCVLVCALMRTPQQGGLLPITGINAQLLFD